VAIPEVAPLSSGLGARTAVLAAGGLRRVVVWTAGGVLRLVPVFEDRLAPAVLRDGAAARLRPVPVDFRLGAEPLRLLLAAVRREPVVDFFDVGRTFLATAHTRGLHAL